MNVEIAPGFIVVKAIVGPYGSEIGVWIEFDKPNTVRTLYRVFANKDLAFPFAKSLTSNVIVKD